MVLQQHPAVADAAVTAAPHADWGEVVAAFLVLRPCKTFGREELRSDCQSTLSPFKHPRQLYFVESVPRTEATGQVERGRLVEIAVSGEERRRL